MNYRYVSRVRIFLHRQMHDSLITLCRKKNWRLRVGQRRNNSWWCICRMECDISDLWICQLREFHVASLKGPKNDRSGLAKTHGFPVKILSPIQWGVQSYCLILHLYWLVVWNMFFSIQLGMSSSQPTSCHIVQRGRLKSPSSQLFNRKKPMIFPIRKTIINQPLGLAPTKQFS